MSSTPALTLGARRVRRFAPVLALSTLVVALGCGEDPTSPPEPSFRPGVAAREVTIDFTSFGEGVFRPDFYRKDGIVFPPQRCGSAGCDTWSIAYQFQGDHALLGENQFGPIKGSFTRPVSSLSMQVAPGLQGTARYVLKAFDASGRFIASTSRTVTQDSGDPEDTGQGYFTMSLPNLSRPAKSFSLDNEFLRSSFPTNTNMPYGVSSITYRHWGR